MLFSNHALKMASAHRAQPPESLGVKGVKHSKDNGVKDSYVSGDKYADIISLSSQASLIDFINPFSL
jgi:hypothetical protein